jgi:hypothetical protein
MNAAAAEEKKKSKTARSYEAKGRHHLVDIDASISVAPRLPRQLLQLKERETNKQTNKQTKKRIRSLSVP